MNPRVNNKTSNSPVALILNADDYGLHPAVDDAVLDCYTNGVLSSASLMVTHTGWQRAVQRAQAAGLPLGLHFNITVGRPVSAPNEVASLINQDGLFWNRRQWLERWLLGQVKKQEIAHELQSQLALFHSTGLNCDHLDSHQHIHAVGPVFSILATCASSANIPLRFLSPLPIQTGSARLPFKKQLKQFLMARTARKQARKWTKCVRHNDFIVSIFDVLAHKVPFASDYSSIFASLSALSSMSMAEYDESRFVVEWMVHPVVRATAMEGLTRIGPIAEAEYAHLLSDPFREALAKSQAALIRYGDLPGISS
jgi:predicted glycoside hydrolase/deacetylase ChbG (UPF0249 family)